jgi:hypothetical protein
MVFTDFFAQKVRFMRVSQNACFGLTESGYPPISWMKWWIMWINKNKEIRRKTQKTTLFVQIAEKTLLCPSFFPVELSF